ncbi:MAG TPA: CBS domain-containing protein [Thiotrichaceae bacterium]|jgi:CBS domain-containing protein|nr:CBS domain-containing protein [Thiotrichaceae bacterium]HIM07518.1 CBS domain-containing protein [Gammaproteobacteria bacterium]
MKIKSILEKKGSDVYSISADDTLKDMVKEMLGRSIGSLLVLHDDGSLAGIITERDFLHNVVKNADSWETVRIDDVMIKKVLTATADETLDAVMSRMTKHRVRHMPVVESDKVVGVLSIGDIIYASLDESTFQNELMKRYIKDWPEDGKSELVK